DPRSIATVMEVLGAFVTRPKRPRTARQRALDDAFVRGQVQRAVLAEKRAALPAVGAVSALRKAVRAGIKTKASANNAQGFVKKIVAEPGDDGERALRDAWQTLIARTPRVLKGIAGLDA